MLVCEMSVPRKIAALRRDLRRHEQEIERLARLRAAGDQCILALPKFVDKYLAEIQVRIAQLRVEIQTLEGEK